MERNRVLKELINLEINGRPVSAPPEATILDTAREAGIEIPTLCHEPGLKAQAQCRLCVVQVEGRNRLEPACATQVSEGMVLYTDSHKVINARRMILELLLSEHPSNCPARAAGDKCKLCDYSDRFGVDITKFGHGGEGRTVRENWFISRNAAACILCAKCARVCDQVQGISALAFIGRGNKTEARPALKKTLEQTDCEMCGNCVEVCPTGAISRSQSAGLASARKTLTTCGFCGVGCQLELNVKDGRVVGVTSESDNPVNGKWLCVKGRFGYEFIHHQDRLTQPLIRRNGEMEPASWDEALTYTAARLLAIKEKHGPDAIAFISSSRCTNEENYLIQKIARAAIGTNSVDQCART